MGVADGCEAAVKLERVTKESPKRLLLRKLFDLVVVVSFNLVANKLSLAEELRITIGSSFQAAS